VRWSVSKQKVSITLLHYWEASLPGKRQVCLLTGSSRNQGQEQEQEQDFPFSIFIWSFISRRAVFEIVIKRPTHLRQMTINDQMENGKWKMENPAPAPAPAPAVCSCS
jgi:hypothetical protein